jgi:hypothetical protein
VLAAAAVGLFDDVDFLVPVLYLGGGMNAADHTRTVMQSSAQITDSHGNHIPLAPMLSWVYFSNGTDNNCAVSQSDVTAVVNTIEQLKVEWATTGTNITVPVVQLWSGQDAETSACADHTSQEQWLKNTKIVPDNCKAPEQQPPLPPRRPPSGNFSNDTCLEYTQAGYVIESIDPPKAANTGGTLIWITGRRFTPNASNATCRFFMSRQGATWGSEVAYEPFSEILVPTTDPVTRATVVNSTHAFCTSPPIVVPVGNTMNSPKENFTIRVGGPAMIDLAMDGKTYSGFNPNSPSNLWLYSPLSATFGRKPYIAATEGTVLYRIHPALGGINSTFRLTVKCGTTVLINSAPARGGTTGVLPFSFTAGVPSSVSMSCTVEMQTAPHSAEQAADPSHVWPGPQRSPPSSSSPPPPPPATSSWTEEIELIRVKTTSPVQTVIDYETRSIQVDGAPFLPFGYFTHEPGLAAQADQLYLTPLGVNNFMHYMFYGVDTPKAVADYVTLLDDVTQMGAWIQPNLASVDAGIGKNPIINWTAMADIVHTLSPLPGA